MTTKKDASGTPDYVGVVDSGPFPPVKRYDLGTRFYNSLSVPEIVETPDGKYVTHDDYLTMVKINDYLQARLVKLAAQIQAIEADHRTRAEPVARWAVSGDGSNRGALPLSFTTENYERFKSIPDGAMLYTTPQVQQQTSQLVGWWLKWNADDAGVDALRAGLYTFPSKNQAEAYVKKFMSIVKPGAKRPEILPLYTPLQPQKIPDEPKRKEPK